MRSRIQSMLVPLQAASDSSLYAPTEAVVTFTVNFISIDTSKYSYSLFVISTFLFCLFLPFWVFIINAEEYVILLISLVAYIVSILILTWASCRITKGRKKSSSR